MMMNHNPTRGDREDEKRMLPCRYITNNGFCHRGARCRFYHPAPGFQRTAIKVPPLPEHFGYAAYATSLQGPPPQPNGIRQGMFLPSHPGDQRMRSNSNTSNMNYAGSNPNPCYAGSNLNMNYAGSNPNLNYAGANPNAFRRPWTNSSFGMGNRATRTLSECDVSYGSLNQSLACESSSSELSIVRGHGDQNQNTVFRHINWREFLAPGHEPPPPIKVPEERPWSAEGDVDMSSGDSDGVSRAVEVELTVASKPSNEDMPPEGFNVGPRTDSGKLTPREELQMKVKQIALELALEPKASVQVLDSFFLNFDFKAAGYSPIPTQIGSTSAQEEPKRNGEHDISMEDPQRSQIAEAVVQTLLPSSEIEKGENKKPQ